MRRILLRAETPDLTIETVDEATDEPFERIFARYDAVIPADQLSDPPIVADGIRLAFLTMDLDSFERLRNTDLPGDLLFKPSPVARLDLLRASRSTLVTTREIKAGDLLTEDSLTEVPGGIGLSTDFKHQVVGRRVLYDMPEGAAIDFGFISEDEDGPSRTGRRGELM